VMWIEKSPRPYDFCGYPPCPHCYDWSSAPDAPASPGMEKFALDMMQKSWSELSESDRSTLIKIASKIHQGKLNDKFKPQEPLEPVDIGLSQSRRLDGLLKLNKPVEAAEPRKLNCDEIADRTKEREEA
jgi:hypothetical protein